MATMDVQTFGPHTQPTSIVTNRPFEARFEEVSATAAGELATVASGKVRRDSRGRIRKDIRFKTGDDYSDMVVIELLDVGIVYALEPRSRVAVRMAVKSGPGEPQKNDWIFPGMGALAEIGQEVIEGLNCRHVRTGKEIATDRSLRQNGADVWIADTLEAVILETRHSSSETVTWRLFDIHREEPVESLFEAPAEYTIMSPPAIGGPAL